MKLCTHCDTELPDALFYRDKNGRLSAYCRPCNADIKRDERAELRRAIFEAYGGKCTCCGEEHQSFLCVDHVDGGGNEHRKAVDGSKQFYRWLWSNGCPPGFQLLCHNCNHAKHFMGRCDKPGHTPVPVSKTLDGWPYESAQSATPQGKCT